jgi:hypothetical protein
MRATVREPPRPGAPGRPRRRPWQPRLVAPVVQRDAPRRVVAVAPRLIAGTAARVATRLRRSPGAGVSHTSDIARRTATCRERLAGLTRRGRALARRPRPLPHGLDRIGTVDTCCTPHASVGHSRGAMTPAMATGLTDHGWTVRERRSCHVPPPRWTPPPRRGRRSRARQRLLARWCP